VLSLVLEENERRILNQIDCMYAYKARNAVNVTIRVQKKDVYIEWRKKHMYIHVFVITASAVGEFSTFSTQRQIYTFIGIQ